MSGFAPSLYNKSNNEWLNDLVSGIIDHNDNFETRAFSTQRKRDSYHQIVGGETEPTSKSHRSQSRDSYKTSQVQLSSYQQASRSPRKRMRSLSSDKRSAVSRRPTTLSRKSFATVVETQMQGQPPCCQCTETLADWEEPLSLDPFHKPQQESSPDFSNGSSMWKTPTISNDSPVIIEESSPSRRSDDLALLPRNMPKRCSSLTAIGQPSRRHGSGPRFSYSNPHDAEDLRAEDVPSRSIPWRTSLGRTMSAKRLSEVMQKPPLARVTSNATRGLDKGFTEFSSHPAVRPFKDKEKSSEIMGLDGRKDDHKYPQPLPLAVVIIGMCLSVFVVSVDRTIITTATPEITKSFQSFRDLGWYGSIYFTTAAALQPMYGRIYMTFDTKWTFLVALAIFEIGSTLSAISPYSNILILGRALQGFGSAGLLTGAFVVISQTVPLHARPLVFTFAGIFYGVGALAGPLLGGIFTDLVTWRWTFWVNLPVGATTFIGILVFFKPNTSKTNSEDLPWGKRILGLDLLGTGILVGAFVILFLALQSSVSEGSWDNPSVIGLLSGFGVTFLLFVVWLWYRGDRALIPPRIICQRMVAASCGMSFFLYGGLLIHAYYLPIWFQAINGDSATQSGINMIPYMVGTAAFSMIAGMVVSRDGLLGLLAFFGCAISCTGSGLLSTLNPSTATGTWIAYELLTSAGLGLAIQQGFSAVQSALPAEEVPIGTAAAIACQSLGGAIFVSVGNTILQERLVTNDGDITLSGVDVRAVFRLGATAFRSSVASELQPALIQLYSKSLQSVFTASIPLTGLALICALCMEWKTKGKKQETVRKC